MPLKLRHTALVAAALFFLLMIGIGSIPNEANKLSAVVPDKLLHMTAYGFLSALLYIGQRPDKRWRGLTVILAIGILGALDETIQSFFPYRTAGLPDWLFDMLSACIVVTALSLTKWSRGVAPKRL
jgi:VanZ family protein